MTHEVADGSSLVLLREVVESGALHVEIGCVCQSVVLIA